MKVSSRAIVGLVAFGNLFGAVVGEKVTLPISNGTVHWGYFSKLEEPVLYVNSTDEIVVEMATHHACDDWDKMVRGDPGMESVYTWNEDGANEAYRGATGQGDGVHVLTGPIYVNGAEPGDILKVEILDLKARANPDGKKYGSNAAAWWGFHARTDKADGTPWDQFSDEVVTIYEIIEEDGMEYATPSYQFEWPTIFDPQGKDRNFIAYPGTCVPHDAHGDTIPSSDGKYYNEDINFRFSPSNALNRQQFCSFYNSVGSQLDKDW